MRTFKHMNLLEREKLFGWRESGISLCEIGRRLGKSHTSLSRELKRNTKWGRKYIPCLAQRRAERVGNGQRYSAPLKSPEIFLYVREHLRSPFFWTPEMISGRIGYDIREVSVGVETIYRHIYSRKARKDKLWQYLPSGRKKRRERYGRNIQNKGKVPNALSIDLRPKSTEKRRVVGHWETDNLSGARPSRPALSVTVERTARLIIITKMRDQTAKEKTRALCGRLGRFPSKVLLSITQDNGRENYDHQETSHILGVEMFFCHAYQAWEKGGVENRNRVIRRFFPKGTDFTKIPEKSIQNVERVINSMPMKCLNYLTPYEKMQQLMTKLNST